MASDYEKFMNRFKQECRNDANPETCAMNKHYRWEREVAHEVGRITDAIKKAANEYAGDAHSNFLAIQENLEDKKIKLDASKREWAFLFIKQIANEDELSDYIGD